MNSSGSVADKRMVVPHRGVALTLAPVRQSDPQDVGLGALRSHAVAEVGMNDEVLDGHAPVQAKEPVGDLLGRHAFGQWRFARCLRIRLTLSPSHGDPPKETAWQRTNGAARRSPLAPRVGQCARFGNPTLTRSTPPSCPSSSGPRRFYHPGRRPQVKQGTGRAKTEIGAAAASPHPLAVAARATRVRRPHRRGPSPVPAAAARKPPDRARGELIKVWCEPRGGGSDRRRARTAAAGTLNGKEDRQASNPGRADGQSGGDWFRSACGWHAACEVVQRRYASTPPR
jgi:hypothetical protein